ncbi:hypothetical protein CPB84DRAFT_1767168 [Gymnopilus junonius]|uniref:Uncharacterized protein n=1 Tax=Gymnopilus junonius TaxID=109634 RepID=A0A9P5TT13_GYMJU|nr:hypothetical protein CPB84DRAFT_1767168 [Gymnopilus junonius]
MQSVEELRHRRRMQSVSAQAPYTVPLDDYSFNSNTSEDYSQIWSPSYPTHAAASPSSSSSSSPFEHYNTHPQTLHALATRRRDPARKLVSIRYLEDVRRRKTRQAASTHAPFPMPMPSYVADYSDNESGFDPYSPPSKPPSYSSPSSFGSFSPSPSPLSSSSSSSGSYPPMNQTQSFIHPEAMGGPSALNMGYAQVPSTAMPPMQYPMDRMDNNYNYRHDINTQSGGYYAHTSKSFSASYKYQDVDGFVRL